MQGAKHVKTLDFVGKGSTLPFFWATELTVGPLEPARMLDEPTKVWWAIGPVWEPIGVSQHQWRQIIRKARHSRPPEATAKDIIRGSSLQESTNTSLRITQQETMKTTSVTLRIIRHFLENLGKNHMNPSKNTKNTQKNTKKHTKKKKQKNTMRTAARPKTEPHTVEVTELVLSIYTRRERVPEAEELLLCSSHTTLEELRVEGGWSGGGFLWGKKWLPVWESPVGRFLMWGKSGGQHYRYRITLFGNG